MALIRGVLLAGPFRTQHELNGMSADDQRNTLIVELVGRTNQTVAHFQAMDDATLAGTGATLVFLRRAGIRTDDELKSISDDDQRNILIVEIGSQTGRGSELQGLSNMDLVLQGLGMGQPSVSMIQPSYIRGVLLAGQFRTQHELNQMSADDQRNTLIVELTGRTNQAVGHFQAMNDAVLAGTGAVLVLLRGARIRSDEQLRSISDDDQRNILIVEIDGQTQLGSKLQGLRNMDLVLTAMGVNPVFPEIRPRSYIFKVDSLEIIKKKADGDHNDSDWLSIVVTIGNPITKDIRTLPAKLHHIGGNIPSGILISPATDVAASAGRDFVSDSFTAGDSDVVVVTYVLTNLGSSDSEEQVAQAIKVTDKVVQIVGPIAGAAIGLFFGAPGDGFKIGQQVAKGIDTAISTLGDVFDFLGIHAGPANCNGEVFHDSVTYQAGELAKALNQSASRQYTGPKKSDRCGGAPESKINFRVIRDVPDGGF